MKERFLMVDAPLSAVTLKGFEDSGRQFYYFYDLQTLNTVYIFNDLGRLHQEISLNEYSTSQTNDFSDILIEKIDDFFFLTKDNKILRTNNQLAIKKSFSYFKEKQNGLRFAPFLYYNNYKISVAILSTWPVGVTFENDTLSGEYLNSQPVIAKINIENGVFQKMGEGILHRFLEPLHNSGLVFYTSNKSGEFIYHSPFTDTIYQISRDNHIQPIAKIKSQIGDIICPKITTQQIIKDESFVKNTFISNTWINYVIIDDYSKLNYIIIRRPLEKFKDFPFNILIYDNNWKKLDELEFSGDTYKLNFLVTKDGLLMERSNNKSTKRTFDCLVYHN